jgi:nucleoside-diphosphate-sugar epimerase
MGTLGRRVVRTLVQHGRLVTALDIESRRGRPVARTFESMAGVRVVYVDLANTAEVDRLVSDLRPAAVLHLAASIPPGAYARPDVAYSVNVRGTQHLVAAVERSVPDARFVLASSVSVYGSRNGGCELPLLDGTSPLQPRDNYGHHKVQAERSVQRSRLPWTILRLGGIIAPEMVTDINRHAIFLQAIVPLNNRIHTVYVEDAALAFANSLYADVVGSTLLLGGDDTHRLRQSDLNGAMMAIAGLGSGPTIGLRGNPIDDTAWFVTDWMETEATLRILDVKSHTIDATFAACSDQLGKWRRGLEPLGGPARRLLAAASPYRSSLSGGQWADPWGMVRSRYGEAALAPSA